MRDGLEKWNDLHPGSIRGALWQLWGLPEHPEQQLQGENPSRCQWSHTTPTITITNEKHYWLDSCCHLQPKLSNSSPGSIAVAALLTWSNQQTLWQVRLAWTSLALDQLLEAFHEIFTWFPSVKSIWRKGNWIEIHPNTWKITESIQNLLFFRCVPSID